MTDPADIPKTTMYAVARELWGVAAHNSHFTRASEFHWDNLAERDRQPWYQHAVRIIDLAEPVWRARIGVEYVYGNQIRLSEEAHGPDVFVYAEYPEEDARAYARMSNNIRLVRKIKTEWEIAE